MNYAQQQAQIQEKALAKKYGGQVSPGSGNGWTHKNDIRAAGLSIEAKFTGASQFILKQKDLHTAENHALLDSMRQSVFIISFAGEEWAVIREPLFRELWDGQKMAEPEQHEQCGGVIRSDDLDEPIPYVLSEPTFENPMLSYLGYTPTDKYEAWAQLVNTSGAVHQPMLPGADKW